MNVSHREPARHLSIARRISFSYEVLLLLAPDLNDTKLEGLTGKGPSVLAPLGHIGQPLLRICTSSCSFSPR